MVERGKNMSSFRDLACTEIIKGIEGAKPDYLLTLPCSTIGPVIEHFENSTEVRSFPISREEDGVGIAAGISLGGEMPVMLIQDTGIGNSILAITTFAQAYHVPMLILVTRRGGFGEINSAVNLFSEPLPQILDDANVKTFKLDYRVPLKEWSTAITHAAKYAQDTHRPIIVMFNIKGGADQ
jgi:sulfopyruvate decarboxylase subunit alpha